MRLAVPFYDSETEAQKKLRKVLNKSLKKMTEEREKNKIYTCKCVSCKSDFKREELIHPEWYKDKFALLCVNCYDRLKKINEERRK